MQKKPSDNPSLRSRFLCFFGRHEWERQSTQYNGIGFLDECKCCGKGRYLHWAGHGSSVGTLTKEQMQAWHRDKESQTLYP